MTDYPIPTIDISKFSIGNDSENLQLAREVADACERIGFLVIEGHGISQQTLDSVYMAGDKFFALSQDIKNHYKKSPGVFSGYTTFASINLGYTLGDKEAKPDLREAYSTGRADIKHDDPFFTQEQLKTFYNPLFIWPDEIAEYRDIWNNYFQDVTQLAEKIMHLFAMALELPADYFDEMMGKHVSSLSLFNYPEQKDAPQKKQMRGGAHTDYGSLTVLNADWSIPGGLQVYTDDQWLDVRAKPGTFVVNLGDMMQRWTNDKWVSTLHRVTNPPADSSAGTRRQSLVYFHIPNPQVMVECVPSCEDAMHPAKYAPISIGDHHLVKMGKMREHSKVDS